MERSDTSTLVTSFLRQLLNLIKTNLSAMNPDQSQPMISAIGLTRLYKLGDSEVIGINQVDLEIAAGELVVLKGNSGSGKSTLLSLLAGLDRPTQGDLTVSGHDLTKTSDSELTHFRRQVVGMVFQSFNLLPTLNVLENVCLPALLAGKSIAESRLKAADLLKWLGLDTRLSHLPAQLSGGEMQRTAIARALINDPSIILADEPTGNSSLADSQATVKIFLKDGMITDHP
jgi:ABC-type lipoprotein export system ATPase subunit